MLLLYTGPVYLSRKRCIGLHNTSECPPTANNIQFSETPNRLWTTISNHELTLGLECGCSSAKPGLGLTSVSTTRSS